MESNILEKLRNGEVVELGDILFKKDEGEIKSGDLYIAERNTGPQLLTAKNIVGHGEGPKGYGGWIVPTCNAYSYDLCECVKVVEVKA